VIRENLLALRERRAVLIAKADEQRGDLIAVVASVERAAVWYDRAKALGRKVREHPLWVAAGVALLVAARPRSALKLFASGFSLWRAWRRLSVVLDRLAPAQPVARRAN
jgi:hypothetical protein